MVVVVVLRRVIVLAVVNAEERAHDAGGAVARPRPRSGPRSRPRPGPPAVVAVAVLVVVLRRAPRDDRGCVVEEAHCRLLPSRVVDILSG